MLRRYANPRKRKVVSHASSSTHPPESPIFQCPLCEGYSSSENGLRQHLAVQHKGRDYRCVFCNETYLTQADVKRHRTRRHADQIHWALTCPECGLRKPNESTMYSHRKDRHGLRAAEQNAKLGMDVDISEIRQSLQKADDDWKGCGAILPYTKHLRCPHCGECQARVHTWAFHTAVSCVLKRLPGLGKAFKRNDLQGMESCGCADDPASLRALPCNHLLRVLLDQNTRGLRAHPEVVRFFQTLSHACKKQNTKTVYLLMRATPNTPWSQEELARRVFYVGQTGDLKRRLNNYYDTLTGPINEMNKREERFRHEHVTAVCNRESVVLLKVQVVIGEETLHLFHPDVLESSIMFLIGMDRLSNIELSLRRSAGNLSDKVKAVLPYARLAAYAAFETTSMLVDTDKWDKDAWVDVTKEMRKRDNLYGKLSSVADVQSTTLSHATTSDINRNATFSSSSGQAASSSVFISSLCEKQVSSGQSDLLAEGRSTSSKFVEGCDGRTRVPSGHASTVFATPRKKPRLSAEPTGFTSTLRTPDSVEGRPATKSILSFKSLVQKLGCSVEEAIRDWCPARYFVASDGVSASYLPVVSSPVPVKPSESSESVELWPLPHGSIGTFAQSQRRNG